MGLTALVGERAVGEFKPLIHRCVLNCVQRVLSQAADLFVASLWSDMSLVGPCPGLINQQALTAERERLGVYTVRPGITGLAQVNGIDMSTPALLAETDHKMISEFSLCQYFRFIFLTLVGKGSGDRIKT